MPDYKQWNTAIIDYFTEEVPKGTPIYLTVNDEVLKIIGNKYFKTSIDTAVDDFENSIRNKCTSILNAQKQVCLNNICSYDSDDYPLGVAFLSAMVLAAHRMAGEGDIDASNYFMRFCQLLQVAANQQGSRPNGMELNKNEGSERGAEVSLWRRWNAWLESHGLVSTAKPLANGPLKYLNYTIEQALLRDDDVEFLRRKFRDVLNHLRSLDEAQLRGWMTRQNFTRKHLKAGLESYDEGRVSTFLDAAYRVYDTMVWDNEAGDAFIGATATRCVIAGIERRVSGKGVISYWMLPRRPTHWQAVRLDVLNPHNTLQKLELYRVDLFRPTWSVNPFVESSAVFKVLGDVGFDQLVFPVRDFWVLTEDPDDMDKTLATWDKYPRLLGKKFMLLLKGHLESSLAQELLRYKNANLIDWEGSPKEDERGWIEFNGCMILSHTLVWAGVRPISEASELYDALKPWSTELATLSLSGGMKAPNQKAWLKGYPPILRIYGFELNYQLYITLGQKVIGEYEIQSQEPIDLKRFCEVLGTYRLQVKLGSKTLATRELRIISWDNVEPAYIESDKWVRLNSVKIRGPWLEKMDR
jgi:hypothetical protein